MSRITACPDVDPPWLAVMLLQPGGSRRWKATVLKFTDPPLRCFIPLVEI
jgi:hypothetical protein